jgi:hypothetical protein
MDTQVCKKCGEPKNLDQFSKGKPWCKSCVKDYDAARYLADKEQIMVRNRGYQKSLVAMEKALKENPCADCETQYHFSMMEWDHLPGFKKLGAPRDFAKSGQKKKMLDEIAKCDLVCANCHSYRTYLREL